MTAPRLIGHWQKAGRSILLRVGIEKDGVERSAGMLELDRADFETLAPRLRQLFDELTHHTAGPPAGGDAAFNRSRRYKLKHEAAQPPPPEPADSRFSG